MSEEKEAFKVLKDLLEEFEDVEKWVIVNFSKKEFESLRICANLIEKQQKEIENNKKFKKDIVNSIMLWDEDEEDLPENDRVIVCLDTIISEFSRLENIEDEKIQVAVEFVEEKRDKYWKDKIREIISKYVDIEEHINYTSQELYGEDLKNMIIELLEGE